ncbi:aminotransferase class III-fold pyridoxal phosphate-dependent enzyme [Ensifer sp. ENS06]|uniref:aspartate aminotransferase family protein n=1 Tax=Ensifer sp. ENS06 TaxID=2769276 RepID=UPI00177DE8B6|nr:aminotransferase class III-fold pyridoxal phosphate-dependent enzyme [Ensifer sp. ENS06]MBD9628203.1 aminotransferase class III-fold pyridoxal phosphate-dependent enzyme [Ensifer sp. ENS06]
MTAATNPAKLPNSALLDAVETASAKFASRNPQSRRLFDQAQGSMPGGNTRSALYFDPFPLYVIESFDARIKDADGHVYLDALGEFTAGLYGHSDPNLRAAIIEAASRGVSNGAPGEAEIKLAELICDRFPAIEAVRFCNSGTEANLYALTLAKAATKRTKLVAFSGAYHGGVFVFGKGGDLVNAPYDWTVCQYNEINKTTAIIEELGANLAAVIVEPMMSNGGCLPATREFLEALRRACDRVGALLIFDEVVTSRMGPAGSHSLLQVTPDLVTLGKYLGAGFSFGAFGGRAHIMDLMDPRRPDALPHAGTFNNNAFTMNVGYVGLNEVFTREKAQALYSAGESLRERLNRLAQDCSSLVQFTGCGSAMNIHFVSGPLTCPEDLVAEPRDLFKLFHFDLMESGIYAARRGQINLSLAMTDDDLNLIEHSVARFLQRYRHLIRAEAGEFGSRPNHEDRL